MASVKTLNPEARAATRKEPVIEDRGPTGSLVPKVRVLGYYVPKSPNVSLGNGGYRKLPVRYN